jgi:hypothetical protein
MAPNGLFLAPGRILDRNTAEILADTAVDARVREEPPTLAAPPRLRC